MSLYCVFFVVFEEAFSVFDVRASGKIPMKQFFPLIRTLGYNIHKAEAFDYMNELELAGILILVSYILYHISYCILITLE